VAPCGPGAIAEGQVAEMGKNPANYSETRAKTMRNQSENQANIAV
jgi:hypothetical protein